MESIGKKIKALREERNLSDEEFAKALGIAKSTVWAYEGGKKLITVTHLTNIADFFGVSADYLLDRSTDQVKLDLQNKQGLSGYTFVVDNRPMNEDEIADAASYIQVRRRMGNYGNL
ncbi:helix-turn-helix domain-containing protein [Planococcus lenghuensis]|uniref:Transcriptional regulator n=1 Tax=Planococcus lenghuensis TaxID=2213202 RepID=A0A1Q2L204_9BACL|nr:helix-turn-helix transcriptional regulator [Planococcus lenghuensis]AQQ54490.1 transcriptional regulator [Planococcus lenghuensis]